MKSFDFPDLIADIDGLCRFAHLTRTLISPCSLSAFVVGPDVNLVVRFPCARVATLRLLYHLDSPAPLCNRQGHEAKSPNGSGLHLPRAGSGGVAR
jgi:hypothetical protein